VFGVARRSHDLKRGHGAGTRGHDAGARCSLELHDHLILYKKIGAEVSNTNSAIPDVNRCLFDDTESAIAEFVSKRASIDVLWKAGPKTSYTVRNP